MLKTKKKRRNKEKKIDMLFVEHYGVPRTIAK